MVTMGLGLFSVICGIIIQSNTKELTIFEDTGHVIINIYWTSLVYERYSNREFIHIWLIIGYIWNYWSIWRKTKECQTIDHFQYWLSN